MAVETSSKTEEAEIRKVIERAVEAVRAKNVDAIMTVYAPGLVSFDIVPPLYYQGLDAYRQQWTKTFAAFNGPMNYEIHALDITAGEDIAFSHSLNHVSGTLVNGQAIDYYVRWTACFRKLDGQWLIAHMQASLPVDMATGKAVTDLTP